jgi:hypothetical protein
MEEIAPLVSIEKQMKSIVACTMSLLSASTLPVSVSRGLYHYNVLVCYNAAEPLVGVRRIWHIEPVMSYNTPNT